MAESWEMSGRERRYSVPVLPNSSPNRENRSNTAQDLHAWSIYRQNLNSDFADAALGSNGKAPLPYGNFQLDSITIQSILNHPKCGPKSELSHNTSAYLKFGLPRVAARSGREESSGYDSSNDGSPVMHSKNPALSKSDPDFRKHFFLNPNGAENKWAKERRMKSISEANLLAADGFRSRPNAVSPNSRPASQQSKYSKMGSHISFQSRQQQRHRNHSFINGNVYPIRDEAMLNEKYFPRDEFFNKGMENDETYPRHPHLQIRGLSYEKSNNKFNQRYILDNISLEVRAGEILGVLATSEREGTALLEIIANHHQSWGYKLRGDIVVNGVTMAPNGLSERVAYVQQDIDWSPDVTVRNALIFTSILQGPGNKTRNFDTNGRIDALIQDLGLFPVRHSRVQSLTISERRRLNVVCHLLLDTDIVLLDQPTKGLDIFDTFFLVEYLRQWAARGRIVILTIHPPTYEIFTMLSRVALISYSRLMYCGRRREMLPYFAFIEFPCPAFKNPSDYYLDLVTLDNLTAEALLESSQRAELLAETFRRRQEPLSDSGPPGVIPPRIKRANCLTQMAALWVRAIVFCFPKNLQRWFTVFITSTLMSVIIGAIFWDIQSSHSEQEDINDRIALHYVLATVSIWPTLLLMISDIWREKNIIAHDTKDRLYGRFAYFVSKSSYSMIASIGVFLGYIVPAYALAGFNRIENRLIDFALEIGYMGLYLFAARSMALAFSSIFPSRHWASIMCGLIGTCVALTSGFAVHILNLGVWTRWFRFASPLYWTLHSIDWIEFNHLTTVECSRNPITRKETPGLVTKISCGISNGTNALDYWAHDYDKFDSIYSIIFVVAFWVLFKFIQFITSTCFRASRRRMSRHKQMQF